MKRAALSVALSLLALLAWGQPTDVAEIYAADGPRTFIWSEVTTDIDGNPLLPDDVVHYRVYVVQWPMTDNMPVLVADDVVLPEATIDVSGMSRGWYYVGVSAFDATVPGVPGEESEITWSNDEVRLDPTQRFCLLVTATLYLPPPETLEIVP